MQRILEPEFLEDPEQSLAHTNADFATSNQWFVDHFIADIRRARMTYDARMTSSGGTPGEVI
jgi:hypothetical protein